MAITDEITQVIRDRIQNFQGPSAESTTTGVSSDITVADGIARVYGLSGARYSNCSSSPAPTPSALPSTSKEDSVAVPDHGGDYTVLREKHDRGAHHWPHHLRAGRRRLDRAHRRIRVG